VSAGAGPAAKRPWWVAAAGAGSVCVGGLAALGGGIALFGATVLPESARGAFALAGAAWLVPGLLVASGGVGLLLPVRWGRPLSLAGAALGLVLLGAVVARRAAIAPALADGIDWGRAHPEAGESVRGYLDRARKYSGGQDPLEALRDPGTAEVQAWVLAGECCLPVGPWHLALLVLLGPPWGRRAVEAGVRRRENG
jgi:hypothetical protein